MAELLTSKVGTFSSLVLQEQYIARSEMSSPAFIEDLRFENVSARYPNDCCRGVDEKKTTDPLYKIGTKLSFNTPHSSLMGGM